MHDVEESVRDALHNDAVNAPRANDLTARIVQRAHATRRLRVAAVSLALMALAGGVGTAVSVAVSQHIRVETAHGPTGAIRGTLGATYCLRSYSPRAAVDMPAALDGTVLAIDDGGPQVDARVRLSVNGWFSSAGPGEVVVQLPLSQLDKKLEAGEELAPPIQQGTRLLVSGTKNADGSITASVCGFTRYYDAHTAAAWRTAATH